jgi:hypothetical protein
MIMSNSSKAVWQREAVNNGIGNDGVISVTELMATMGCGLQHATNSVKTVIRRLADNSILYYDGGLTRDESLGVPFRYSVPGGKARATEADLANMLTDMLGDIGG